MNITPYVKAQTNSASENNEDLAKIRAQREKSKAEVEIAKLREQVHTGEAAIHEKCKATELDYAGILNAIDDQELAERRLKKFTELKDKLFPAESDTKVPSPTVK